MSSSDAGPDIERLPGIGTSLDLVDADGRPVQAVRLRDGSVELFVHPTGGSVSLDPAAARSLGAFVSGHFRMGPDVSDRVGDVLGGLVFDWIELGPDAHAVGRTIQELEIRRRTGVTVVAVLRGHTAVVDPEPGLRFERGDELVVACGPQDRDDVERFLQTGR
jgi:K+:H+ antiporter subunit KhtT